MDASASSSKDHSYFERNVTEDDEYWGGPLLQLTPQKQVKQFSANYDMVKNKNCAWDSAYTIAQKTNASMF